MKAAASERSLQEERGALTLEIQEFVREKGAKEGELEKIALQLEEERSEFENYRSAAQQKFDTSLFWHGYYSLRPPQ